MEFNNYQFSQTTSLDDEIRKVALLNARELSQTGLKSKYQIEEFYVTSGLKIIFNQFFNDGQLRDVTDSCFIEFSTLSSLLGSGVLDAFTLVYEKKGSKAKIKENVETNFKNVIKKLREDNLVLLNHPDYMIRTTSPRAILSCLQSEYPYYSSVDSSDKSKLFIECLELAEKLFQEFESKHSKVKNDRIKLFPHFDKMKNTDLYINSSLLNLNKGYEEITSNIYLQKLARVMVKDSSGDSLVNKTLYDNPEKFKCYEQSKTDGPLLTLHLLNHLLYNRFFLKKKKNTRTIFASLPLVAPDAILDYDGVKKQLDGTLTPLEEQKFKGLGSLFVFLQLDQSLIDNGLNISYIVERLSMFYNNIASPVKDFIHGYAFENAKRLNESVIKEALIAAISQVMARNLSHNIGSHVLPEYRNYFREHFPDTNYNETSIDHLKSYFDYTQNRMELIADTTISQNDRATFVYTIHDDIIKGFKEIYSKNVGLGLLDAFKLHPNGTNLKITSSPSNLKAAIPGGQLGISAFYLILENIIRNYYKHSNKNLKSKTFTFKIVVNEPEINYLKNHYWQVDIIDEMGSENQNRNIQLLYDLQAHINKNILDENKKLRQFGWGFIEMKAAAAYLLNYPLDRINNNAKTIDGKSFPEQLLEVGLYDSNSRRFTTRKNSDVKIPDNCKCLGYRFYLKKAKSILIDIDMLTNKSVLDKVNQFSNKGIEVETINPERFKRTEHEIVISNKEIRNINQRRITVLPRTFDTAEEFTNQSWKQYVSEVFKEKITYHNTLQEYQSENHNSDEFHVLLDEHRDFFLDDNGNNVNGLDAKKLKFDEIKGLIPGKTLFFHGSSKVHPFPENVLNIKNKKIKDEYRIIETVCTQVSIYDERIQKDVLIPNSDYSKLTLRDLHELSGVFIPLKNCKKIKASLIDAVDLDAVESKRQTSHLKKQIVTRFLKSNDDFLILHFTLFEKMFHWDNKRKKYKDIQDYYERFSRENKLTPNHKIVFSSGRGRPSNLVNNCLYLNLSTLQEVLVNKPSKYALVNLLKSL